MDVFINARTAKIVVWAFDAFKAEANNSLVLYGLVENSADVLRISFGTVIK